MSWIKLIHLRIFCGVSRSWPCLNLEAIGFFWRPQFRSMVKVTNSWALNQLNQSRTYHDPGKLQSVLAVFLCDKIHHYLQLCHIDTRLPITVMDPNIFGYSSQDLHMYSVLRIVLQYRYHGSFSGLIRNREPGFTTSLLERNYLGLKS